MRSKIKQLKWSCPLTLSLEMAIKEGDLHAVDRRYRGRTKVHCSNAASPWLVCPGSDHQLLLCRASGGDGLMCVERAHQHLVVPTAHMQHWHIGRDGRQTRARGEGIPIGIRIRMG